MNNYRKDLLLYLYGEHPAEEDLRVLLEQDRALRDEYRMLSEAKFSLDRMPAERPGAHVLDRVVVAAPRSRRMLLPGLAIAAAILLAVAVGLFSLTDTEHVPSAAPALATDTDLSWDDGSDVRRVYRRIDTMRPNSSLSWDEPPVPLESLPSGATGNLLPAGAHR